MSETPPPDGIPCPRCNGTAWEVLKTAAARGRIVRYRRCAGCGHVVRTREVFEATPKPRPKKAPTT